MSNISKNYSDVLEFLDKKGLLDIKKTYQIRLNTDFGDFLLYLKNDEVNRYIELVYDKKLGIWKFANSTQNGEGEYILDNSLVEGLYDELLDQALAYKYGLKYEIMKSINRLSDEISYLSQYNNRNWISTEYTQQNYIFSSDINRLVISIDNLSSNLEKMAQVILK